MSDSSIYQTPQFPDAGPPSLPQFKPAVVTVFSILHLVFAGLAILAAAWGLFILILGNPFLRMSPPSQVEAQLMLQEKTRLMSLTTTILSLLVTVPMIIAGIQMLRNRMNGLKWSNGYACASLCEKVINIILTFTIMLPAMKELTDSVMGGSHMPAGARSVMSASMIGGAIGGAVITCIYPLLTLILLNRAGPKAWFASLAAR